MAGAERVDGGPYEGSLRWPSVDTPSFHEAIGPLHWQRRSPTLAIARVETRHGNGLGALHGGFIAACVDMALFAAAEPVLAGAATTTHLSIEYLDKGVPGAILDIEAELVSDRKRRLAVRVLVFQEGRVLASASGSLLRVS